MLMTMEMWSLGVAIEPARLMLFVTVHLMLLVGMASYARRDKAIVTRRDALDAFAAYGVGVLAAATVLLLFGVVEPGMSADAITRTITIQAAPAAFGAMVAQSLSIAMTCIGYVIALSISFYILWTFGRTDGLTFAQLLKEMIVLGFPAALGAGAARLLF
jgi:uncharacterized membrane protein